MEKHPIGISEPIKSFPVVFGVNTLNDQIAKLLAQFISDKIIKQPTKIIQADEPLITSGLIDSFSLVDLALFIENSFNVRIDDTELTADVFDTLRQLVELIESRLPR